MTEPQWAGKLNFLALPRGMEMQQAIQKSSRSLLNKDQWEALLVKTPMSQDPNDQSTLLSRLRQAAEDHGFSD